MLQEWGKFMWPQPNKRNYRQVTENGKKNMASTGKSIPAGDPVPKDEPWKHIHTEESRNKKLKM